MTLEEARNYANEHGCSVRTAYRKNSNGMLKKGQHLDNKKTETDNYKYSKGQWV